MKLAVQLRCATIKLLTALEVYNKRYSSYMEFMKKEMVKTKSSTPWFLDLGAGSGLLSLGSAQVSKANILAVDLKTDDLRRMKSHRVHPLKADAQNLPFQPSTVDLCMCISLLEHLPKPAQCVREMTCITKTAGRIIVQIPNLRYILEPHTKWPLLHLMPSKLKEKIKEATGYSDLNLKVDVHYVTGCFADSNWSPTRVQKIFHSLGLAKLLLLPLGWFLIFECVPSRTKRTRALRELS
jgi:2-polyprenyl-3-methyl-5-hydroxy-6-metoxy-1,4-benzoquinol methylase